ncbi:MAG: serine/threonine protein kinase [Polyangiaceae bacterium]|nr:serine/threonine protein kinase [Polyangiaceae bacterium]
MTANAPVKQGDVLAGKYRVDRVLGEGGMGVVVAATHTHLGQRVALKFLLPELANRPDIIARFDREARAAVKIQSEPVARVLDTGILESGAPYMVMEYLEGSDLAQLLRQRGQLDGQEAIEYILQACEALAEAHVAGIVHRDLKPANLFLTRRADGSPCVKVLDFGISKATLLGDGGPGGAPLTQTSAMMGSPKYMSPEQLKSSRDVDARTDIWALGVVLYELLTGGTAFTAPTMPELCISILQAAPAPLRQRRPDAPPGVEAIILRCLEKDPSRRYATVAELAVALGEFAPPRARVSVERVTRILQAHGQATALGLGPGHPPPGPPGHPTGSGGPPHQLGPSYGPPHAGSQPGPPPVPQATAAGAYGPGYAPPPPGYGGPMVPAPQGSMAPAPGTAYAPPAPAPQSSSLHPSTIILIVLVAGIVLSMGGCVFCVCLGAAAR